jgi:thioesterase domain-containing protein
LVLGGVKLVEAPPLIAEGCDAASRRVHLASVAAGDAYRPSPYAGRVVFLQPDDIPNLEPRSPEKVWGKFLSRLEVCRIPGSHLGILDKGAAAAAAAIGRCVAPLGNG